MALRTTSDGPERLETLAALLESGDPGRRAARPGLHGHGHAAEHAVPHQEGGEGMKATRARREAVLDRIGRAERARKLTPTHRRAVLAGAPERLPDVRRREAASTAVRKAMDRKAPRAAQLMAAQRTLVFGWAKRVGAATVSFDYPGGDGHEHCREVCITYS